MMSDTLRKGDLLIRNLFMYLFHGSREYFENMWHAFYYIKT